MKKIDGNKKITLTLGQLKKLVNETALHPDEENDKKCKWVAWAEGRDYIDESDRTFDYEYQAYADMAEKAVLKMLWNTEYADFSDCDSIGYSVVFTPTAISHDSYSGVYVYAIIDEDETLTDEQKKEIEERIWKNRR